MREQAFQCNQSRVLIEFAREKLYLDRIVRPAVTTVERLVAQVRKQTEEEIFSLIYAQFSERMKVQLSKLLVVEEGEKFSQLQQFKEPPPQASPSALLSLIRQIDQVREIGIDKLDFPAIYNFGINVRPTENLTVLFDYTYAQYTIYMYS